ncbi:MAG: 50S ribosomal protein L25/general stress protein Ctc [Actinomycetota bacterium]|nr:50S ribosomal protein L25/general stress protein Ctc [Actinomycetota bacterium]
MEVSLSAEPRSGTGKGVARKLRAAGKVPGNLYGASGDPVAIAVDARLLGQALHTDAGRNVLIDLKIDGETHLSMARELQRDPLKGTFIHVDFLRINRNQAITVDVPIHVEGESPGVKEGGVVDHHLWNVRVECLPGNVPESLIADISNLALGSSLHVSDLALPDGVTMLTNEEEIVLSVVVPQVLKVEEEVPAEAVEGVEGEAAAAAPEGAPAEGAAPQE